MNAPGEAISELERNLRINDSILRYLTVKLVEKQSKVKPKPVRQAPAEAAPAAETAPEAPAEAAPAAETAPEAPAQAE
jgi:predicted transcriptional regulator